MTKAHAIPVVPFRPSNDPSELWDSIGKHAVSDRPTAPAEGSVMEQRVSVLSELHVAPRRTLHNTSLVKSSPLSVSVRAMMEAREFGRRFDAVPLEVASLNDRLPTLECPEGDVIFAASDRSAELLSLSVDGLLQHRKRLLAPTLDRKRPRRHVFIVGAGPAGLVAAIQLSLRDHHVVVCEQREVYARNRYIGVYKEVTHLMAALGMPESMTYDFSQYRGKRGIMLADIQTLLHGVALKLGVVIYTGAVPKSLELNVVRSGEIELQRAPVTASVSSSTIGITRWHHDSVAHVSSGVRILFDTIIEATGGRCGLRETLVGEHNVASVHEIGRAAAEADPSLDSFFNDPEDHCAEYVDSDYGCPPGLLPAFSTALRTSDEVEIPAEIPCFVSNIDASVFTQQMKQADGSLGLASRIGDRTLTIPHDWVVLECRLADGSLSRYHIEGPLPQTFEFGGQRVATKSALAKLNPVSFLLRILYAMGMPFDAVDRRQLVDFYSAEASRGDASDIVSTWLGRFRGLRVCAADAPVWCGPVPGSDQVEYAVIGEALQNAWYRFGVGVDDAFTGAACFAESLELPEEQRLAVRQKLERVMQSRAVQILYHLYAVARDKDQGVVGSVLSEYHMDERHRDDLAEARLRSIVTQGAEMRAAEKDLVGGGGDPLLEAALDHVQANCCRSALSMLESSAIDAAETVGRAQQIASSGRVGWRAETRAALDGVLAEHHQHLLAPLFSNGASREHDVRRAHERSLELASARYRWVSSWLRACALRTLDPRADDGRDALEAALDAPDALVSEVAGQALSASAASPGRDDHFSTFDKVLTLKRVSIFAALPHEVLVPVARLLTLRRVAGGARIIDKGAMGDALYVIAAGRVRVHDGDRTLREMSANESFGELSLLDSEPRSASVTALEPTVVLRLTQDDFYPLMREQPEITRGINRTLCALIRVNPG
jgi:hypothetical protein